MAKTFTIQNFFSRFPDDNACLDRLMKVRYGKLQTCPKCGKHGRFARLSKALAYSCPWCGHHIHPMVGTPFERSSTPLQKWFYAMYMFTTTRNGVAAKELQRQLGVTYKTAWRIGHELRKYMAIVDGDDVLGGPGRPIVEADEAFIGGKDKIGQDDKTVVLGMVERKGDILTRVVPDRKSASIIRMMRKYVREGARIATDEGREFMDLQSWGYCHEAVNHLKKEWVRDDTHTNTIESFWAALKRGINGTHIWVSPKHLQKYLYEFEFRHNLRRQPHLMFDLLLVAFPRP
jgi:transposase-like protein